MKFSDDFLEDIRSALPPSAVLGKKYTMIKRGVEYVAKEDESISCNDAKKVWADFGKGDKAGDIFTFVMWSDGCDFIEAVKRCASQAGIPLPAGAGAGHRSGRKPDEAGGEHGADHRPPNDGDGDRGQRGGDSRDTGPVSARPRSKRTISATYDYTDAQGHLIYQVVRYEPKGFAQRRPYREEESTWVWALDAGEFMRKGPNTDWWRFDKKRFEDWHLTERAKIEGGVEHGLYMLPELLEAIADERLIFLCEGEKDCDSLDAWDLAATTNSGGAKHFTAGLAATFAGADVVVLIDNDKAGRDRGHDVSMLLRGIAKRVRVLDIAVHWAAKEKEDVTDWIAAGGTKDKLYGFVEATPEWKPEPPASSFGALRFVDLDLPAREYQWLIKGILTRGERSIMAGPPGSGKSYEATDIGLAVARAALEPGFRYLGRRVHGGLVLYQAGEGGLGLRMRLRAYRKYHAIDPKLNLPFVLMPQKLDLFTGQEATDAFIAEAKKWSAFYEMPVELTVIDTVSAASAGANENISEDMTLVLDRGQQIANELKSHVMFVHHMNKQGGVRGWSGIMGNIESAIEVNKIEDYQEDEFEGVTKRRVIREAVVTKQKDGEDGLKWRFTLPQVVLGYDEDNEPITACVVRGAGEVNIPSVVDTKKSGTGIFLTDERAGLFSSLLKTLDEAGVAPPAELKLPASVPRVCQYGQFTFAYRKRIAPTDEDKKKHGETIKSRLKRFSTFASQAGIIAVENVGDLTWIWPTGKPVFGRNLEYPRRPKKPKEDLAPVIDPATGDPIEDIDKPWF